MFFSGWFPIRLLAAAGIAAGLVTAAACGSTSDDKPIDVVPDAGKPPRPPPPEDAGIDATDPDDRDFETTLVADEPGAEVQIAVSALTGRIVVAWIGINGGATIRYAISDDKGTTFTPAKTAGASVGDPIVGALSDGSFLVGGLRADCTGGVEECTNGEIFLGRIAAGQTGLVLLPSIHEPPDNAFIDHPWMSVHGDDVSIVGAAFPLVAGTYESGMTAWKSVNLGQDWTRSEIVTASASNAVGIPRFCAGDGNRLVAHFYDGTSATEGTLRYTDTADDGWSLTNAVPVGGTALSAIVSEGACVVKADTIYALLGVDVTSGGGGAGDSVTPVYSDIHLVVSEDLGKTWNDRATIAAPSSQYLLPEIFLEPDDTVDVFYYRGEKADGPGTAEMVRITGKTTVGKPLVVRDGLVFVNDRGSPRWLGDYNGIGYLGVPIMAFGDNATTKTKIRFGRLKP